MMVLCVTLLSLYVASSCVARNMYWCDAESGAVETAGLDGQRRRTLSKGISTSEMFDIAVHGGFAYWTDVSQKGLFRCCHRCAAWL